MNIATTLNAFDEATARQTLENCCAAQAWVGGMLARRPFVDDDAVKSAAGDIWNSLAREEWLAAFAAHPKIGDVSSLKQKYAGIAGWAANEQSSVAQAAEDTLHELARYNQDYEARFGYIFIVCATGKSAAEMLELLKQRIASDPAAELQIAAAEQLKITQLRLGKLAAGTA